EAAQARAEALARALAALEAASPDRSLTTAALARARDVVAQADRDIQALTVEHGRLTTLIDLRAGEGVEEDLADTTDRLAEATARRDALRFEVEMLKTLLAALETARAAARDRYVAPVLRELTPLLRLLWPDAEIAFDEDRLLPVAMTRAGQAEAIEILSGGTQEQVALLVRLAFARMLAAAGRAAPVILDDALVFTDDDRIERMFDALHRQAGDVQILVLSCRQRAFRNLGGQQLRIEAVGGAP
ncbi:MAG: ATP-binding protein, partial [Gemmobacter sp.]